MFYQDGKLQYPVRVDNPSPVFARALQQAIGGVEGEIGGTSQVGEIWYAEAEAPVGPWLHPRKIVTHDRYSFYNPVHHPEFDEEGGRRIYFEGTYTREFSGNPEPTPRYDYNQIMYRLDLADPRLR